MRQRARKHRQVDTEINITAFLNLMVVLIPFLLITATFSQITVLDLNMPGSGSTSPMQTPAVQLQMIVRHDQLEVGDASSNVFSILPKANKHYDFARAHEVLKKLKTEHSDVRALTLLLEDDIDYEVVIQAMDHSRYVNKEINGQLIKTTLFPRITLGKAPPRANENKTNTGRTTRS
jgi:biopolymer transport protein ExbD